MRINENTALVNEHVLLVPYRERHVQTYHEWMQSEELRALTASEPLTLPEEYAMQASWRRDADKLTFIVCLARPEDALADPPAPRSSQDHSGRSGEEAAQDMSARPEVTIIAGEADAPERMVGDVNLFLSTLDDLAHDEERSGRDGDGDDTTGSSKPIEVVGEVEIMIARPAHRGRGLGRAALLAFLRYVLENREGVLGEYASSLDSAATATGPVTAVTTAPRTRETTAPQPRLAYLRVRIDQHNAKSIGLFRSVGFVPVDGGKPNYFGEVELRLATSVPTTGTGARGDEDSRRVLDTGGVARSAIYVG